MPNIRINKVIRDLNVGLPTLIEFLQKRGIEVEKNPNAKISLQALIISVEEFGKDWKKEDREALIAKYDSSKTATSKTFASKREEGKENVPDENKGKSLDSDKKDITKEEETIGEQESLVKTPKVGLTIKGHIDLNPSKRKHAAASLGKKEDEAQPSEPFLEKEYSVVQESLKEEEKDEKTKENTPSTTSFPKESEEKDSESHLETNSINTIEKEDNSKESQERETQTNEVTPKETIEEIKAYQDVKQVKEEGGSTEEKKTKKEEKNDPAIDIASSDTASSEDTDAVFRLHDNTPKMGVKVIGKVDLSTIESPSRTSRKGEDRKKRKRINRKKVDIEKEKSSIAEERRSTSPSDRGGKSGGSQAVKQEKGRKAKRQQKLQSKPEISQEEIQKQIKETLAQMQSRTRKTSNQAARYRRDKRDAHRRELDELERVQSEDRTIQLTEYVTANDLAQMIEVPVTDIITMCFNIGMMVSINQRLERETIDLILEEYGYDPEYVEARVLDSIQVEEDSEEDLQPRAPIVTVMGHVDHGKTSLLDAIRNTSVISGEAGGITQHVGAYSVTLENGRKITFLDTPGHEAFTAMRARGAKVTDIVIVVVAADDGVMPQTKEAINHASLAGVPIIFAINKVDKPHANPDKIKEELSTMNYLVEDWGGKYQSQDISAKKNIGIHDLLEKVLLEADMLDLKANPDKRAAGTVIESTMEVGRGYTTKVLIQEGTLRMGDHILAGTFYGRVKALFNERGQSVKSVGPSDPVVVLGLNGAAQAGETFNVLETEQEVRDIAAKRTQLQREQRERMQKVPTLENLGQRIADGNVKELNIIVKGDVDGSVEALSDSIQKLSTEEIRVNVIHKAVGQISDSDVMLATASDAVIIGFQVRPAATARRLAESEGVEIRTYSIIYTALDEVKAAMEGMLSPEIKENITANLEVLETFKITKVGTIAGCMVKEGKISRQDKVRLIRDGIVKYDGHLGSLKRYKDDAKEVVSGLECGLNIENYNDIQVGDTIEAYEEIMIKKKL